jgi:hypothetical protein
MKMAEPFSLKQPMTAVRSCIKHEDHEVIFIRKNDTIVRFRRGALCPLRKGLMGYTTMKQVLLLVCIGLFAVITAGCITNDAGKTVAENQSGVAHAGNGMPQDRTGNLTPPSGDMNETAGSMGPLPPGGGFMANSTDGRPIPPDGMNGTPGSMGPGAITPGQAPPDRPYMNQTGIPQPGITRT